MNTPAPRSAAVTAENALIRGDLSGMDESERLQYYSSVCKSLGLNPLTRPFEFLNLQGKTVLYARRDAADQLRKINGISIEILSQKYDAGLYTVHVRARTAEGRVDEDIGCIPYGEKLAPEFASNARMKCITKAKRRVTLSISGLGWLDETEVEDIPEVKSVKTKKLHEPESGPAMTLADVNTLGSKLLRAIRTAENKKQAVMAVDMVQGELDRMQQQHPDRYDDLIKAVDREMAEHN